MRALAACVFAGAFATTALALETAQWPPPGDMAKRMSALQQTLRDPQVSPAQREAAREELAGLLKSPAGQLRGRSADEKPSRPARAAIDPFPSVVTPINVAPRTPPPAQGVARLEVVEPPRPVVDPRSGSTITPTPGFAVDPRTGGVLHETPFGYVDPRTGRVVPR